MGSGGRRRNQVLAVTGGIAAVAGGLLIAPTTASAAPGCRVAYTANSWNTGFTANIVITNLGDAVSSWKLEFDYAGNQAVTNAWNGVSVQSGKHVTINNAAYNGSVGTNATVNPGFQGTYSGTNADPTSFKLNGTTCNGTVTPTSPVVTTPVVTTPVVTTPVVTTPVVTTPVVTTPVVTTPVVTTPVVTTPTTGTHLDNPFVGAKWYVNSEWAALAAAEPGGSKISNQPTAVWLDSIASITAAAGSNYKTGLQAHLDAALAQGATVAQFVIYDLPGRDCAALASNGEIPAGGTAKYQSQYIDPIVAIEHNPKYAGIRIVNIVEPDSLPNLVTNAGSQAGATAACATEKANGDYEIGVAYALKQLHNGVTNVYNYVDAGHHAWLGWPDNISGVVTEFASVAQKAGGFATVDGFITNTANYSALQEPFVQPSGTVNGQQVKSSKWIDWNDYSDELSFAQGLRTKLVSAGFTSGLGMLIDTSRNGWGGSARPTAASTSTDLNTWVDASRIDRRIHAGNWCNQSGAGIGERPKAAPASGIDAYTWIKPPGESDGASQPIANNQGKGFDGMCDPAYAGNGRNGNNKTGALPNSPLAGAWFSAQFQQLLANAYPAL